MLGGEVMVRYDYMMIPYIMFAVSSFITNHPHHPSPSLPSSLPCTAPATDSPGRVGQQLLVIGSDIGDRGQGIGQGGQPSHPDSCWEEAGGQRRWQQPLLLVEWLWNWLVRIAVATSWIHVFVGTLSGWHSQLINRSKITCVSAVVSDRHSETHTHRHNNHNMRIRDNYHTSNSLFNWTYCFRVFKKPSQPIGEDPPPVPPN